jgi:Exostosin family
MASIFLTGSSKYVGEFFDYPRYRILESHSNDVFGSHRIVSNPDEADVVLFATNYSFPPVGLGILAESAFRREPSRCVLFDSGDGPSPIIGGLCASWSNDDTTPGVAVGWCYHHPTSAEPMIKSHTWQKPAYLWSFIGSQITHQVRAKVLKIGDPEAFVEDTSERSLPHLMGLTTGVDKEKFLNRYITVLQQSAFILCPIGKGPSSMRIFEAMRAGRAPVIISDAWTPPPFVQWEQCSLRIPEAEVLQVPEFLRKHRGDAQAMGERARAEWDRVFGPTGLFHHTVEASVALVSARPKDYNIQCLKRCKVLLRPPWRRLFLRGLKVELISRLRDLILKFRSGEARNKTA